MPKSCAARPQQTTSLGDRHPAVIEIQAQAERLKRMIDDEVNRIALAARADYESAKASEDLLARNVDALKQSALTTDAAMVTCANCSATCRQAARSMKRFWIRARETGEQERVDTKNIQVISKADVPLSRSSPPSNTLLALGAIFPRRRRRQRSGHAAGQVAGRGAAAAKLSNARPAPTKPAPTKPAPTKPAPTKPGIVAPQVRHEAQMRRCRSMSSRRAFRCWQRCRASTPYSAQTQTEEPDTRFAAGIRNVYDTVRASHRKRSNPSILIVAADDDNDSRGGGADARGDGGGQTNACC